MARGIAIASEMVRTSSPVSCGTVLEDELELLEDELELLELLLDDDRDDDEDDELLLE